MTDLKLTYNMPRPNIKGKDREGNALYSGLGVLGVGSVWLKASDKDKETDEYKNAPILDRDF